MNTRLRFGKSYTTNIIEGLNCQFRQITKNKPSLINDDSLRRMLYLASQRIVKHWHARCQNWDLVLSQLELMFADRAVGCPLPLTCPGSQGGTTGERFVQYLKETLLPTLRPGDIVVIDNMRSHHIKAVQEILESKGMKVLYLPPYNPDLNPIEKMWSKMKAILRKWKIRCLGQLPDAILRVLACVSQLDCLHWFAASAYC